MNFKAHKPHPSLWLSMAMAGDTLCFPSRPPNAQLWCALEQSVFFCAVFWNATLFLYTLVFHPTTIPDIQRLTDRGYFYWKIKNLCKLLLSFTLFFLLSLSLFSFFPFPPERHGCKLFKISQQLNCSLA